MHYPLVSIGVPIYNEAHYLQSTLASIQEQSYKHYEVIICDNASTDETPEICQKFCENNPQFSYYRNNDNLGAVPNFRRCLELAKGEFFCWVAGHDLRHPDFLAECLSVILGDEAIVLVCPDVLWINESGESQNQVILGLDTRTIGPPLSRFASMLWSATCFSTFYGLYRTDSLHKALITDCIGYDVVMLCELAIAGTFARIPQPLSSIRYAKDFGSWDVYMSKLGFEDNPVEMVQAFVQVINKYFTSDSIDRVTALQLVMTAMFGKYGWILVNSSSRHQEADWIPILHNWQHILMVSTREYERWLPPSSE